MEPQPVMNHDTHTRNEHQDFLPRGTLAEVDPDVQRLIRLEDERQRRRIILIASESLCAEPVRRALASRFSNIYAEGYPSWRMTEATNRRPLDYVHHLAYYRRYADGRYYKGCDYVDFAETLAQKRVIELFSSENASVDDIQANVQPLSGAAANNAVYEALCQPGDVVLGMNLAHGGHLTHGSPINRSGKRYRIIPYGVDPATGRINYDEVMTLAREHKPRMIIGGASAYPFAIDWERLRAAADICGAYLLADIAHPAGLVAAGLFPNPVGIADVTSFTTHKTMCGPRGACLLTTEPRLAAMINTAVFPGEQGGPHINAIIAKAVAFKLAAEPPFQQMMRRVRENVETMVEAFRARDVHLLGDGSDSHLLMIDLDRIPSPTGLKLKGEVASRILELAGIVLNKNTKPGDTSAAHPGAVRIGAVWISQLGYGPQEAEEVADIIATLLKNTHPFRYMESRAYAGRGKVDLGLLEEARQRVDALTRRFPPPDDIDDESPDGYPHYEPMVEVKTPAAPADPEGERAALEQAALVPLEQAVALELSAERSHYTVHSAFTSDTAALEPMSGQRAFVLDRHGQAQDDVSILRLEDVAPGQRHFLVISATRRASDTKRWLRALSDGYVLLDRDDVFKKVEGPALVVDRTNPDDTHEPTRGPLLAVFGLYGPDAEEVLTRHWDGPALKTTGTLARGVLGGVSATVHRTTFQGTEGGYYEILVEASKANTLQNALTRTVRLAARPAVDAVRKRFGLPHYGMTTPEASTLTETHPDMFAPEKVYFVGHQSVKHDRPARPDYTPALEELPVRRTPIFEEHVKLGGNMVPFAGWEMPVRYRTSLAEEHQAVRETCGLFDVSHMGVLDFRGEHAQRFLDAITTNYVAWLRDGQCHYSYLCQPDGRVIDDILVYRRAWDNYMMVVNAANAEIDLAWIRAVASGEVKIDLDFPWKVAEGACGQVQIRDLRDPSSGADRRVDLALQGPPGHRSAGHGRSRRGTPEGAPPVQAIRVCRGARSQVCTSSPPRPGTLARTGTSSTCTPTGRKHSGTSCSRRGAPLGLIPTGLGARDSTRTEAGYPLYGHELAGAYDVSPIEAGYGNSVKFHKPFFIGRTALLAHELDRTREIVRLRLPGKGVKMVRTGNPVLNRRGEFIGTGDQRRAGGRGTDRTRHRGTGASTSSAPRSACCPCRSACPPPKPYDQLARGDSLILPLDGVVIERFL